jgi:hypothetical protein
VNVWANLSIKRDALKRPSCQTLAFMIPRIFIHICLLLLVTSCSSNESPKYQSIEFGVFKEINNNQYELNRSRNLNLSSKASYGWHAQIEPFIGKVKIREELELPAPASNWDTVENMKVDVSPDGRKAVVEGEIDVNGKFIGHASWSLSEGDPVGKYKMRLFLNGVFKKEFAFNVSP